MMVPPRGSIPRIVSTVSGMVRRSQIAVPGVEEADHLVAVVAFGLAHDGADHGVESGAVASAGEHADSHPVRIRDEHSI